MVIFQEYVKRYYLLRNSKNANVCINIQKEFTLFYNFSLIALGLEQFIPYAKQFPLNITQKGHVKLLAVAELIQKYMMPHVPAIKLYHHIITYKRLNQENNPIKFYFTYGKLQQYVHYVFPLNVLHILPPCKRDVEELPKLWADFIYPIEKIEKTKKNVQVSIELYKILIPKIFISTFDQF